MRFKRLLKDEGTGLYYDGHGGWTTDWEKAHDFTKTSKAVDAAMKLSQERLMLVLKFDDSRMDVSHPLCRAPLERRRDDKSSP